MKTILIATSSFSKKILAKKKKFLKKKKIKIIQNPFKKTLNKYQLLKYLDDKLVGILSGNEILDKKILEKANNLRVISRCGVGYDNIDTKYLKGKKIKLCLTDDEHVISTAELTFLHILASLKKFHFNINKNNFAKWKRKKGFLLDKKKVGLIGLGKVGKYLTKLLTTFGCKIYYFDILKDSKYNFMNFNKILKICDIISLHLPLTNKTRNLINARNLKFLKKNAILLNLARGNIINEKDLANFLKKRSDVMVSLDCYAKEPYNGKLTQFENVIMTPHIGTFSYETRELMEEKALSNLCKYIV